MLVSLFIVYCLPVVVVYVDICVGVAFRLCLGLFWFSWSGWVGLVLLLLIRLGFCGALL